MGWGLGNTNPGDGPLAEVNATEKYGKNKKGLKAKAEEEEEEEEEEQRVHEGAIILKQAFSRRAGKKKKELSYQDAAMLIQMRFRTYLVRRSRILRCHRYLAVSKAKLKEIKVSFNNFSYRRRIAHDASENQSFCGKIIVLILTVDDIEGADFMVRAAKRPIIDELEAMLDVLQPQPNSQLGSMKRRTFDMPPDGTIQKEIAAGVAEVVQMLERDG